MPRSSSTRSEIKKLGLSTAKGSVIFVAAQVLSSVVTLLLLVGMTRLLKPAEFGLYSIAVAFAAVLGMGGNFGIGTALRKMLPESIRKKQRVLDLINGSYFISCVLALAISILGIIFSGWIAVHVYNNASLALPLQIASAVVFLSVIMNTTFGALVGIEKVKEAAIADILYSTFQLIASVPLVLAGYGIVGAMVGYSFGFFVGICIGLFYLVRKISYKITRPLRKTAGELLRFSLPIAVSNIAAFGATNFAVLILGVYASAVVVGNYSAAFRLGSIFTIVLSSLTFILLASFSKAFSNRNMSRKIEHIYNSSLRYSLVFILPLLAYVMAASAPLTHLLFSHLYTFAPLYLSVIAFGITLGIIGSFAGTLIISYGDTKKFMYYQIAIIAVELALLIILTPLLNVTGTLLAAFVIAPLLSDMVFMFALERQFSIGVDKGKMARTIIPSLLLWLLATLVSAALGQRLLVIAIDAVLILLLYPPLMVALKAIDRKSVAFIRTVAGSLGFAGVPIEYVLRYVEIFIR